MLKIVRRGKKGIFQIVGTCPVTGGRIRESTGLDSEQHAEAERIKLEQRLLDERTYGKRATATFAEAVILYRQKGHPGRFLGPLNEHFGLRQLGAITDLDVANFWHNMRMVIAIVLLIVLQIAIMAHGLEQRERESDAELVDWER